MANHCIDVICSNCGATYCAIGGCNYTPANPVAASNFKKFIDEGNQVHYYSNLRCRCCDKITIYEYPTQLNLNTNV